MLLQALNEFEQVHHSKPRSIHLTPHAALALSALMSSKGERLSNSIHGIPLTVELIDGADAVKPGTGTRLGLFVRDTGVQQHVAVVELK
jgi:hypothetical protein